MKLLYPAVLTHLLHRPTGIHSATIYNKSEKNSYILQMSYKFSTLKLGEINNYVFKIRVLDMKNSIYLHYMLRVFGRKSPI